MKSYQYLLITGLLCLFLGKIFAQSINTSTQGNSEAATAVQLFKPAPSRPELIKGHLNEATFLTLDQSKLLKVYLDQPTQLALQLRLADGRKLDVTLFQKQILTDEFYVDNQNGEVQLYEPGLYYHGYCTANPKSLAAISIFEDKVYGMIMVDGETYVLGQLDAQKLAGGKDYVLYNTSDLLAPNPNGCATDELPEWKDNSANDQNGQEKQMNQACKIVKIYFEADYRTFLDNNSSETVTTDFVTAMFNVVALLYEKENIIVKISKTRVWTTADNYPSSSSTAALYSFRSRLGGQFDGNVAQLLSTVPNNNGGVAFVGVLCTPTYAVSYANIRPSFSGFPTYSWTVEVVTHELGHNLGSPHTHSCSWPNGPIDDCYSPEGGCAKGPTPSGGGTIMSYCHLSSVGINFQNGFGPYPGELIRTKVQGAVCITETQADGECEGGNGGGDNGGGNGGGDNGGGGNGGFGDPNLVKFSDDITTTGLTVKVNVVVQNVGQGKAGVSQVAFYLSVDNSFSSSDYLVATSAVPFLAQNEMYGVQATMNLAEAEVPPGNYYLGYVIDYKNELTETNESDNTWYWINPRFPLTGGGGGNGGGGNGGGDNGGGNGGGEVGYCKSAGEDATYEWIAGVTIGEINNKTERDNGYGDFTRFSTKLERGSTPSIKLLPGFKNQKYAEQWIVWIDFNKDKDFDDAGEQVFSSPAPSLEEVADRLNIPGNAPEGKTRMRISMKWLEEDDEQPRGCSTFGYGEVEDYSVEITGSVTAFCLLNAATPAEQTPCEPTTTTYDQEVRITYTGSPSTIKATAAGKTFSFAATSSPQHIKLEDLPANGLPVDIVIALSSTSGCSDSKTFGRLFVAPESCQPSCDPPLPLGAEDERDGVAKIIWEAVRVAQYYQVQYRQVGEPAWIMQTTEQTSYLAQGLATNSTYEYAIRSNCQSIGWSDWSDTYVFVTAGTCGIPSPRAVEIISPTEVQVRWYPLPRATEYRLRYRATGTETWTIKTTTETLAKLMDLSTNMSYEYQLSAKCSSGWSGWSAIYIFAATNALTDGQLASSTTPVTDIQLYPNPAKDYIDVVADRTDLKTLFVVNINGKVVQQINTNSKQHQLNITSLQSGVYFIKVAFTDGTSTTKRFVKY